MFAYVSVCLLLFRFIRLNAEKSLELIFIYIYNNFCCLFYFTVIVFKFSNLKIIKLDLCIYFDVIEFLIFSLT